MQNTHKLKYLSAQTYLAVCRFQILFLSSDGGHSIDMEWFRYGKYVPDSRLIAAECLQNNCPN